MKDFKSTTLDRTEESITFDGVQDSATNIIPAGAVIIPTRMAVGKAAINTIDVAINQDLKALLPSKRVDLNFLLHFLLSKSDQLSSRAQGATVKGIKLELLRELPFPRLDTAQQRRIAAILDKADAIRRKREQVLALADDLLKSAYVHLVGYRHPDYRRWGPATIEELAASHKGAMRTGPFGSALLHSEFVDEGVAVLGIDNAVNNRFAWAERRYITEEKYAELERYRVFAGDVIVTIMGTTGRSAVVPDDIPLAITTKHLATITCDRGKILPEVLSFAIHSDPMVIRQIEQANKGAIMDGLNLTIIRALQLPLAPLDEQQQFVQVLNKTRRMVEQLNSERGSGQALFASLSQRAFRGEL